MRWRRGDMVDFIRNYSSEERLCFWMILNVDAYTITWTALYQDDITRIFSTVKTGVSFPEHTIRTYIKCHI